MTDQPTLTDRAERILEVPTTRALSTKGAQDLIRDLLVENARLRKHAGAMAADLSKLEGPPLSVSAKSLREYRAAFPKESTNG